MSKVISLQSYKEKKESKSIVNTGSTSVSYLVFSTIFGTVVPKNITPKDSEVIVFYAARMSNLLYKNEQNEVFINLPELNSFKTNNFIGLLLAGLKQVTEFDEYEEEKLIERLSAFMEYYINKNNLELFANYM